MDYLKVALVDLPDEFETETGQFEKSLSTLLDDFLHADGTLKDYQAVISLSKPSRELLAEQGGFPWRQTPPMQSWTIPEPAPVIVPQPEPVPFSPPRVGREPAGVPVPAVVPEPGVAPEPAGAPKIGVVPKPGVVPDSILTPVEPYHTAPFLLDVTDATMPSIPEALIQINRLNTRTSDVGVAFAWPTKINQRWFLNVRIDANSMLRVLPEFNVFQSEPTYSGILSVPSAYPPDVAPDLPTPTSWNGYASNPVQYRVIEYVISDTVLSLKMLSPTASKRINKELKNEYSSADLLLQIIHTDEDDFIELYRLEKLTSEPVKEQK